jgi:hypothetical protein
MEFRPDERSEFVYELSSSKQLKQDCTVEQVIEDTAQIREVASDLSLPHFERKL